MSIRSRFTALAIAAGAVAILGLAAPASADPIVPPGLDFGSSGAGPGTSRNDFGIDVRTDNLDLSNLPAGTSVSESIFRSNCIFNDTDPRVFSLNRGSLNPLDACNYESSWAIIRYVITAPGGRVAVKDVSFDEVNEGVFAASAASSCLSGNTGCSGEQVTVKNPPRTVTTLKPVVRLGPLPVGPPGSTFCASEGQTCTVPVGRKVGFGVGTNQAYYANITARVGAVLCSVATFNNQDPAPDRVKDCYI